MFVLMIFPQAGFRRMLLSVLPHVTQVDSLVLLAQTDSTQSMQLLSGVVVMLPHHFFLMFSCELHFCCYFSFYLCMIVCVCCVCGFNDIPTFVGNQALTWAPSQPLMMMGPASRVSTATVVEAPQSCGRRFNIPQLTDVMSKVYVGIFFNHISY
jgi:hypothetical protein